MLFYRIILSFIIIVLSYFGIALIYAFEFSNPIFLTLKWIIVSSIIILFLYLMYTPKIIKHFMKKYPSTSYILLLFTLFFVIIEIISFIILDQYKVNNLYNITPDDEMGYILKPNNIQHALFLFRNDVVYNVTYSIDNHSRRIVSQNPLNSLNHILLFGCSYIFGEGLNDNETIQYFLSKNYNKSIILNYGIHGYGPQQMLTNLEKNTFEDVPYKGIALYFFIYDHYYRAVGKTTWSYSQPCYIKRNFTLQRDGNFFDCRRTQTFFYKFVYKLKQKLFTCKMFCPNTFLLTHDDKELLHQMIKQSKETYENRFNGKFIVVFYFNETRNGDLKDFLDQENISYIDSNIPFSNDYLLRDGHFNSNFTEYYSISLIDKIRNFIK
jgi:hypothetical protein